MDIRSIETLERRAFAAWPALRTATRDGWVMRFADGHTKRANSINP
ncbi:MAG: GNAT family N-acetyltransferase, partial [Alphaproteobacteria bacterium]|nr:GNAT family N-acetyltransferase [Alphaproteobacteria bacterium]